MLEQDCIFELSTPAKRMRLTWCRQVLWPFVRNHEKIRKTQVCQIPDRSRMRLVEACVIGRHVAVCFGDDMGRTSIVRSRVCPTRTGAGRKRGLWRLLVA